MSHEDGNAVISDNKSTFLFAPNLSAFEALDLVEKCVVPPSSTNILITFTNSPSSSSYQPKISSPLSISSKAVEEKEENDHSIKPTNECKNCDDEKKVVVSIRPPGMKQLQDIKKLEEQFDSLIRRICNDTNNNNNDEPSSPQTLSLNKPPQHRSIELIAVFLINGEWLRSWYRFVSGGEDSTQQSGEINNWDLIDSSLSVPILSLSPTKSLLSPSSSTSVRDKYKYKQCKFAIKEKPSDFIPISPETWEALRAWYSGGPPIARYLKRSKISTYCDNNNRNDDSDNTWDGALGNGNSYLQTLLDKSGIEIDLWPDNIPNVHDIMESTVTSAMKKIKVGGDSSVKSPTASSPTSPSATSSSFLSSFSAILSTPEKTTASPSENNTVYCNTCFVCRHKANLRW